MGKANTQVNYTFWNKQRLKKGVVVQTVSKDLGIPECRLRTYFSGEHIPRHYTLMRLCDYFGVSVEEGRAAFISDHEIWKQRHNDEWFSNDKQRESTYHKHYIRTNGYSLCIMFDYNKDADLVEKIKTIELGARSPYIKWVLRQHLGNDEFSTERLTPEIMDILKLIYSEVPFEMFIETLSDLMDTKKFNIELLYGYVSYDTYMKMYKLQDYI